MNKPLYDPPWKYERIILKNDVLGPAKKLGWSRKKELGLQMTIYTNDFLFLTNK